MKTNKRVIKMLAILAIASVFVFTITFSTYGLTNVGGASEGFGDSGTVITPIGNGDDVARAVVMQPDGKFVVAGYSHNGNDKDFAVVRYNPDGSLDAAFGTDGIVVTHVSSNNDEINDVAIQPDGKIVAVGVTRFGAPCCQFAMARFNVDGSLDSTFGSGGIVFTSFSNNMDTAYAVAIQPDGKIVATGTADFRIPSDFAIARYNSDGSLDTTFGGDGKVTTAVLSDYEHGLGDVLLQTDGKIILTGSISVGPSFNGIHHFGMVRYNSDGSIDTTFGTAGHVITNLGATHQFGDGAVLLEDGKILMTGHLAYYDGSYSYDGGIVRYNSNGSLDYNFGDGGKVIIDINNTNNWTNGIVIQPDNKIVLSGYGADDFSVLRFNQDGSVDASFNGGYSLTDFFGGVDYSTDLVIQEDGKIILAGHAFNGANYDFALARYNPDGSVGKENLPPLPDAGGTYSGFEGNPVELDAFGSSDPDGDTLIFEWDLDNDGVFDEADGITTEATFYDDGIYTIGLKVTDEYGEFDTDTAEVSVLNVSPTVGDIIAPMDPAQVGTSFSTSAPFSDPGLDTWSATWDWGDGTFSTGTISDFVASGNHAYDTPGVYTISLTVEDDDGGVGTATYQYVVAYDPEGGFVTGGGWIWSPEGAYTPDPTLTGKATFGFVSKYKKGATVPTGNTEFQFKIADLNFKSTSYDWLVIAGTKAMYKGTGTINGMGEYGFMLSAVDGTPDKFRIKIWDKATGAVVYDNQLGAAEDTDPAIELGGGSIVVHNK